MKLQILSWLTGLAGFGLLVAGVEQVHRPSAMIIAGLGLLAWAWLADRAGAVQLTRKGG